MSTRFSPDGTFWWDGQSWQLAISPDGRWRWDGAGWVPGWAPPATAAADPGLVPPTAPAALPATPTSLPAAPAAAGAALPSPPATIRHPTPLTRPLQWAAASYLVVAAASGVAGVAVSLGDSSGLRSQIESSYTSSGMDPEQSRSLSLALVQVGLGVSMAAALMGAAVYLLLAWGGLRAWSWVYIADLAVCGLALIGAVAAALALGASSPLPRSVLLTALAVNASGAVLGGVMLGAMIRTGIWASRRLDRIPEPPGAMSLGSQ